MNFPSFQFFSSKVIDMKTIIEARNMFLELVSCIVIVYGITGMGY